MRLETSIYQRQELQLRLAPQIIASIEILQIPAAKLEEYINQEMEKNPTLEVEEKTTEEPAQVAAPEPVAPAVEETSRTEAEAEQAKLDSGFERLQDYESSWREFSSGPRGSYGDDGKDKKLEAMQNTAARADTLAEYLVSQLRLTDTLNERIRELAEYIIYNVGDDGYLPYSLEDIVRSYNEELDEEAEVAPEAPSPDVPDAEERPSLAVADEPTMIGAGGNGRGLDQPAAIRDVDYAPVPDPSQAPALDQVRDLSGQLTGFAEARGVVAATDPVAAEESASQSTEDESATGSSSESGRFTAVIDEVEQALLLVQSLDPPGVGARSLQECLILQLGVTSESDLERILIERYLDDIVANRLPKISKETGRSIEDIKDALELIRGLNPKPGSVFACEQEQVQYITPDVVVDFIDGKWEVRLEDGFIPRINISRHYQKMLAEKRDDPKVREWIKRKINDANWLIQAIAQRQNTLSKVTNSIVRFQEGFLENGVEQLRPLKMQHVADRVGVHVSTVSRAIDNKYIQTPRGIFPLKFFFTAGTRRADGVSESIVAIKKRVQEIVDQEDKSHPLSDEEIAARLKEAGLDIARRTVTKYRKQLRIPSSRQRREY